MTRVTHTPAGDTGVQPSVGLPRGLRSVLCRRFHADVLLGTRPRRATDFRRTRSQPRGGSAKAPDLTHRLSVRRLGLTEEFEHLFFSQCRMCGILVLK